jgi:hypothetical protein
MEGAWKVNEAILERALKALQALNIEEVAPPAAVSPKQEKEWPKESLDALRRFAQPHAKLFPFIGRKVRTPRGAGTLIQVFAHRAAVVLEGQLEHCDFFRPDEIEPASWELP